MLQDAIGATFVIGLGIVVGFAHLIAAGDPDRNAITRLMRDCYEHMWPMLGNLPSRQAMLLVGIGGLLVALAASGGLIYALTR
jgi:hypothetical protein